MPDLASIAVELIGVSSAALRSGHLPAQQMKSEPAVTVPFIDRMCLNRHPCFERANRRHPRYVGLHAMAITVGVAATLGIVGGTAAKPSAPKAKPSFPDTETSVVTVTASRVVPQVQSTFPTAGAKVAPGLLVLRVTYDTRMRAEGWSYAREAGADYPDCAKAPRLLDDRRSFVMICRTLPSRRYAIWFNRPPLDDFTSFSRRPARPFELTFATTDDEPVRTLMEAMKADPALSNLGNPVEPNGLAVYGQDPPPGGF